MSRLVPIRMLLAAALTVAAAGTALACIEHVPERMLAFPRGSATLSADHVALLREAARKGLDPTKYRVEVRAYADYRGAFDPKTWNAEDLPLAQARARAVSDLLRAHGVHCVERVALGVAPSDPNKAWVPADEGPNTVPGVVVRFDPVQTARPAPIAGVPIEKDCGRAPAAD